MITSNIDEAIARLQARKAKVDSVLEKTANQCGILAKNESLPLTHVKTGNLRDTIHPEVEQLGPGIWQLWFGTRGAFGAQGYNYAPIREYYDGMISGGWFLAKPQFKERLDANAKELND